MSRSLFRPQALAAYSDNVLGSISLRPAWSWVWIALVVAALAVAIVCFLVFGEYTRRTRVMGTLVPDLGLSVLVAPVAGMVAQVMPGEGAQVIAGDPLVVVSTPRAESTGMDSWKSIQEGLEIRRQSLLLSKQSVAEQFAARETGMRAQLAEADLEHVQSDIQMQTSRELVALAKDKLERFKSLSAEHHVSQMQVREQELAVLELRSAQQLVQRQQTSTRRENQRIQQQLLELPALRRAALEELQRELAQLDQERIEQLARGERLLEAAVDGLVAQRLVEPGQTVREGEALLTLLPQGSVLQAQLEVPGSAIGFIEPGDRVLLRYEAFPYQKFGHQRGKVLQIARSTMVGGQASVGAAAHGYYRVLVQIDHQSIHAYGKAQPLRPGMRVEADILADRRKLYEWLFEPLVGWLASAS